MFWRICFKDKLCFDRVIWVKHVQKRSILLIFKTCLEQGIGLMGLNFVWFYKIGLIYPNPLIEISPSEWIIVWTTLNCLTWTLGKTIQFNLVLKYHMSMSPKTSTINNQKVQGTLFINDIFYHTFKPYSHHNSKGF